MPLAIKKSRRSSEEEAKESAPSDEGEGVYVEREPEWRGRDLDRKEISNLRDALALGLMGNPLAVLASKKLNFSLRQVAQILFPDAPVATAAERLQKRMERMAEDFQSGGFSSFAIP